MSSDDYLEINRTNWDARAEVHVDHYGLERYYEDPSHVSGVVSFDRPRLGDVVGFDVVHLQCHLGTDTVSLARLGARVVGVDLSGRSLAEARRFAERSGAEVEFVQSDVYAAPEALGGRTFDLVYTGIGALCWLPSIERWATTVAQLLRPGGRVFVRDGHPVLNAAMDMHVGADHPDRAQVPSMTPAGGTTVALELPYFEQPEPVEWVEEQSYAGTGSVAQPRSVEWNHGLGQIVTAVLGAGLRLVVLEEHDSVPWEALPGLMESDEHGEWRLRDRPERLPASFTLVAVKED